MWLYLDPDLRFAAAQCTALYTMYFSGLLRPLLSCCLIPLPLAHVCSSSAARPLAFPYILLSVSASQNVMAKGLFSYQTIVFGLVQWLRGVLECVTRETGLQQTSKLGVESRFRLNGWICRPYSDVPCISAGKDIITEALNREKVP